MKTNISFIPILFTILSVGCGNDGKASLFTDTAGTGAMGGADINLNTGGSGNQSSMQSAGAAAGTAATCTGTCDPGPAGPQGPKGDTGLAGKDGLPGLNGDPGIQGPVGPQGPPGATVGVVGPQGPQGPAGLNGAPGTPGLNGAVGTPGKDGPAGAIGPTGPQGGIGPTGPKGPAGTISKALFYTVDNVGVAIPPGVLQTTIKASCTNTFDVPLTGGCFSNTGTALGTASLSLMSSTIQNASDSSQVGSWICGYRNTSTTTTFAATVTVVCMINAP